MSSLIKVVILILSLNSQAKWEDWNTTDKNLYKAYLIGSTLDYMQTKNALDNHYIEGNPFLGKYPSADRILLQKTLSAGVIYWSFNKLDEKRKRRGLLIVNGIQWGVVINNENIGATFRYNW
jgi:hypothetical protein